MATGYGDSQFQPYQGTTPVVTVFDTFDSGAGTLHLNVWADDTADVLLDGSYLAHAVFTQSICSGQPIGCQPQDAGVFNLPIAAREHSPVFRALPGGNGFGYRRPIPSVSCLRAQLRPIRFR